MITKVTYIPILLAQMTIIFLIVKNRSDNSSDECDDTDNMTVQQESALVCGSRGRGRRCVTSRSRGSHEGAGDQGGGEQEGSTVVCGGRGRGRGRKGGTSRGRGSHGGPEDQGGGEQEGPAVVSGGRGRGRRRGRYIKRQKKSWRS